MVFNYKDCDNHQNIYIYIYVIYCYTMYFCICILGYPRYKLYICMSTNDVSQHLIYKYTNFYHDK